MWARWSVEAPHRSPGRKRSARKRREAERKWCEDTMTRGAAISGPPTGGKSGFEGAFRGLLICALTLHRPLSAFGTPASQSSRRLTTRPTR